MEDLRLAGVKPGSGGYFGKVYEKTSKMSKPNLQTIR